MYGGTFHQYEAIVSHLTTTIPLFDMLFDDKINVYFISSVSVYKYDVIGIVRGRDEKIKREICRISNKLHITRSTLVYCSFWRLKTMCNQIDGNFV